MCLDFVPKDSFTATDPMEGKYCEVILVSGERFFGSVHGVVEGLLVFSCLDGSFLALDPGSGAEIVCCEGVV